MNLLLPQNLLASYTSPTQQARVLTETWAKDHLYCPNCTSNAGLQKLPNNSPVADLYCPSCAAEYELKAKATSLGNVIQDGAYATMMARLSSATNPHLLLLRYERLTWQVRDLVAVPKFFFVPNLIRARPPLPITARRAGWVGCTIRIGELPEAGRIALVSAAKAISPDNVRAQWQHTCFLNQANRPQVRTWLLATMKCLDRLSPRFLLEEVYTFETDLQRQFPANHHIRDKLRQQLQILREQGYLRFVGRGVYERI